MSEPLDIEAIEARLNAATPGPWASEMDADKKASARDWREVWAGSTAVVVADGYERHSAGETETVYGVRIRAANAELIANAPEDLRALLAEIRRLTVERDRLRSRAANAEGAANAAERERDAARRERDAARSALAAVGVVVGGGS